MIIEKTASAESVEQASELARKMLNAPDTADVRYEIISRGKKKTFGLFGGAPAQVKAYYEIPDPAPEKKAAPEKKQPQERKPAPEKKAAPEKKPAPEKKAAPEKKPAQEKKAAPEKKPAQKNNEKPAEKKEAPRAEEADAAPQTSVFAEDPGVPANDEVSRYLTKIIALMGVGEVSITVNKSEKNAIYTISGNPDEQRILIGRRGETLDALQYLSRLVANMSGEDYDRVALNVGNFRQKREVSLRTLAKRNASQVLKYGRNVSLDPMNPYERRIIHTAVQEIEGVHSFSVGSDASRRVIIALDEGVQPTHPSKGGYGNNRGGRGGYGKKDDAPASPARAPKSDVEGVALYTKYEIRKDSEE